MSLMVLSALFGFGFAGNMTGLSLCVRQAVPASRFGGALGAVMMIAWAGMSTGGYLGGVLFNLSRSYTPSFALAGISGVLNLLVIGALFAARDLVRSPGGGNRQDLALSSPKNVAPIPGAGCSALSIRARRSGCSR